jgi:hypothetical protein
MAQGLPCSPIFSSPCAWTESCRTGRNGHPVPCLAFCRWWPCPRFPKLETESDAPDIRPFVAAQMSCKGTNATTHCFELNAEIWVDPNSPGLCTPKSNGTICARSGAEAINATPRAGSLQAQLHSIGRPCTGSTQTCLLRLGRLGNSNHYRGNSSSIIGTPIIEIALNAYLGQRFQTIHGSCGTWRQ